uniref:Uncharacterized protein n=1 Tax=Amphimedon queenslandica TaxID=400682 RepID=A0A1X7TB72_AMPQE
EQQLTVICPFSYPVPWRPCSLELGSLGFSVRTRIILLDVCGWTCCLEECGCSLKPALHHCEGQAGYVVKCHAR